MAAAPSIAYFQNNLLINAGTAGFKMCCDTHKGVNFGKCYARAASVKFSANFLTISKSNSITGLDRPGGFQEVQAPIFQDNRHINVGRLSAIHTGRLYSRK
jgi:hypothetical protein